MSYIQYIEKPFKHIDIYAQATALQLQDSLRAAGESEEHIATYDSALELGAGQGMIALALFYLLQEQAKVVTLDYDVPIHPEVAQVMGDQLESHLNQTIVDFLAQYAYTQFDLLTLVNVGKEHGIEDANQLARVMKPKGIVIDSMTGLSDAMMQKRFAKLNDTSNTLWRLR